MFQMAPRLKILMASGSKKGTQTLIPFFFPKSPSKRNPSRFPNRAPMERERPAYRTFLHISCYNSFYSVALRKERPSMFPKSGAPMETNAHSRVVLNIRVSFEVPSQGALPPGPPHGVPTERDAPFLQPSFIHHSKSPVYKPPPPLLIPGPLERKGAPMERDARVQSPS